MDFYAIVLKEKKLMWRVHVNCDKIIILFSTVLKKQKGPKSFI